MSRRLKVSPLDPIEAYAILLHKDLCERRGELPRWRGRGTNRAYWRRKARATDAAARPESPSVPQDEPTNTHLIQALQIAEKALRDEHGALEALMMTYLDGDNEGEHGGDQDDTDCPTCQVIVRAQDAYRRASEALASIGKLTSKEITSE